MAKIPCYGQGTRSHMVQLRVCMPQLKDPRCQNKDRRLCTLQLRPGAAKYFFLKTKPIYLENRLMVAKGREGGRKMGKCSQKVKVSS